MLERDAGYRNPMGLLPGSQAIASSEVRHPGRPCEWWLTLYRHPDGRYFVFRHKNCDHSGWSGDREGAVDWMVKYAVDPETGGGYTREQADKLIDAKLLAGLALS